MSTELKNVTLAANEMAREIEQLKAELAELTDRARRVAVSHDHFIQDHSDPGTEALAAQYELINWLSASEHHEGLPLNPVETALRVVLATLDELADCEVMPDEIRAAIAEALPREDMSDLRRRIYIDGRGHAWLDQSVSRTGVHWVAPLVGVPLNAERADDVVTRTGSLRPIGRCW